MNEEDKKWMDILMEDKGRKYKIVVDNDIVWVEDESANPVHDFNNYGWYFIIDIMQYLGLNCEGC